jgi:hypothetical protein
MAYTTPSTWVDGAVVAASDLNAQIRDNVKYLKGTSGVISLENAVEIAESAVPATPAAGYGRIYIGNASPNNGIPSGVDDAGAVYQMLTYVPSGTFTPTIIGTSTAGTGTYTTQYGIYTRIGNVCHIWIRVTWTAHTGTGNGTIGGLPFSPNISSVFLPVFSANITYTNAGLRAYTTSGVSTLQLYDQVTGAFTASALDTAADLLVMGSYLI